MLESSFDAEEKEGYEFIVRQLLELARFLDYGDEVGRKAMSELTRKAYFE
jgi:hypothetical protein